MNRAELTRDPRARKYARRRLKHDYEECLANPLPSIAARPVCDENFMRWHGNITGPPGTSFEGYYFHIEFEFPDTYPRESPRVRLLTELNHTFVFKEYKYICINMLENEWDQNHIDVTDRGQMYTGWSSAYSVQAILVQLQAFLFDRSHLWYIEQSRDFARAYKCIECKHSNGSPSPKPNLKFGDDDDGEEKDATDDEDKDATDTDIDMGDGDEEFNGKAEVIMETDIDDSTDDVVAYYAASDDVYQTVFTYLDPKSLRCVRSIDERFDRIVQRRIDREKIRSELRCFFSKMSYREEVLGLGLTIEYYRGNGGNIRNIEPTLDLLGYTAYHDLDQRKGVWKEEFTHFLPVYLSQAHGDRSLPHSLEAMTTMCSGPRQTDLNAVLCIIPKMLNTMVVNTMKGNLHESLRALQGYCYFNHLFLALCELKPEIRAEADRRIESFLRNERNRTKKKCPALGDWITLLLVSDRYSWADVCDVYLQENFDRNVKWIEQSDRTYCLRTNTARRRWNSALLGTDVSRKLAMFHVLFLKTLREKFDPKSGKLYRLSTHETKVRLDETFGRPNFHMERDIQPKIKKIKDAKTWDDFFRGVDREPLTSEELDRWLITAMYNSRDKGYHRSNRGMSYPSKPVVQVPKADEVISPFQNTRQTLPRANAQSRKRRRNWTANQPAAVQRKRRREAPHFDGRLMSPVNRFGPHRYPARVQNGIPRAVPADARGGTSAYEHSFRYVEPRYMRFNQRNVPAHRGNIPVFHRNFGPSPVNRFDPHPHAARIQNDIPRAVPNVRGGTSAFQNSLRYAEPRDMRFNRGHIPAHQGNIAAFHGNVGPSRQYHDPIPAPNSNVAFAAVQRQNYVNYPFQQQPLPIVGGQFGQNPPPIVDQQPPPIQPRNYFDAHLEEHWQRPYGSRRQPPFYGVHLQQPPWSSAPAVAAYPQYQPPPPHHGQHLPPPQQAFHALPPPAAVWHQPRRFDPHPYPRYGAGGRR